MRGITKAFAGVRRSSGVDLEVRRRRGALRARPERRGQVDAHQDPRRRATSPTAARSSGRASRSTIPNPVAALELGIATMYQELDVVDGLTIAENIFLGHELADRRRAAPRRGAPRRPASCSTRLGHGDLSPHREVGTLSAAQQADRQHGARALARHQAHHHGRAERRARLRRGQEPVPGRRRAHRRRASPSSTSRTASRRSARSATASRSSRTARAWRAASPSPTPRRPSSSGS